MAIIKKKQLKQMNKEDLNKRIDEIRLELSKEAASIAVGMPKNPGKIKEMKKTIARILTIRNNTSIPTTAKENVKK